VFSVATFKKGLANHYSDLVSGLNYKLLPLGPVYERIRALMHLTWICKNAFELRTLREYVLPPPVTRTPEDNLPGRSIPKLEMDFPCIYSDDIKLRLTADG